MAKREERNPKQRPKACAKCGSPRPEGQLPWAWDVHITDDRKTMLLTCSVECRIALGFREWKKR